MAQPFEFDFSTVSFDGTLGRVVESIWYARGTVPYDRERIAPTGSTVAVFVLSDAIIETPDDGLGTPLRTDRGFLIGPHDRPVVNEPTGETYAVGIVTTAIGCEAVFGLKPAELRCKVVPLEEVWPVAPGLRRRLLAAASPKDMLAVLEDHLQRSVNLEVPGLDRIELVAAQLVAEPTRSIADVAAELGITHGYLDRQFGQVVGLSPRRFARLLRMRSLLAGLDVTAKNPWTSIAADLGWFDQSHLIRDFKRHTGTTANRYVAAQVAALSPVQPGDAAGFVPEFD